MVSILRRTYLVFQVAIILAFTARLSHGEVLLNDNFADGENGDQNLPEGAKWYKAANSTASQNGTTLEVSDQTLVLTSDSEATQTQVFAYFGDDAKSLDVGDSLKLSFTISVKEAGPLGNGFRFGLFNSDGRRDLKDGFTASANYAAWTGYSVWTSVGAEDSGRTNIRKRSGENSTLFDGSKGVFVTLPGNDRGLGLADDTLAKAVLTLARVTEDEMTVTFELNGVMLTSTDNSKIVKDFDAVVFRIAPAAAAVLALDDITVAYAPRSAQ